MGSVGLSDVMGQWRLNQQTSPPSKSRETKALEDHTYKAAIIFLKK
jgi:hypothetical protein